MNQGLKFLIKTVSCVLLVGGISILVSGCADQRYKPTECTVTYKINTYPVNGQYSGLERNARQFTFSIHFWRGRVVERRGPQHVTNCFFLRSLIMYGMQIVAENGAMWMSPDFTPMNLIDRVVIPGNNGYVFQSRIPDNMQCMFFIRFDNDAVCITREFSQNGFKCLQIIRTTGTGNITVYAFGNMVIDVPRYGGFIFDASGRMVYHAGMKPLEVQTTAISGNMKPRDMGQPIAVSPCASYRP